MKRLASNPVPVCTVPPTGGHQRHRPVRGKERRPTAIHKPVPHAPAQQGIKDGRQLVNDDGGALPHDQHFLGPRLLSQDHCVAGKVQILGQRHTKPPWSIVPGDEAAHQHQGHNLQDGHQRQPAGHCKLWPSELMAVHHSLDRPAGEQVRRRKHQSKKVQVQRQALAQVE